VRNENYYIHYTNVLSCAVLFPLLKLRNIVSKFFFSSTRPCQ